MSKTIFFSWQSDTPGANGRHFLREVLNEVCERIATHPGLDEAERPELDHDTKGVTGQPPIFKTILDKIDNASAVIVDLTYMPAGKSGKSSKRTPNPNVLIEYGWALKAHGIERIIYVMNDVYGAPPGQPLPFDLQHQRWPTFYSLPEGASKEIKAAQKKALVAKLSEYAGEILRSPTSSALTEPRNLIDEMADRFRTGKSPLGALADFMAGVGPDVFLIQGPALWLMLHPPSSTSVKRFAADVLQQAATRGNLPLRPLYLSNAHYLRAGDGFGVYVPASADNSKASGVAFAFESGDVLSVDKMMLGFDSQRIPIGVIEKELTESFERYVEFLQHLGFKAPFRWSAGMVNVKGRGLEQPNARFLMPGTRHACLSDSVTAQGHFDGKHSAETALQPFFDEIWRKCGLTRPKPNRGL